MEFENMPIVSPNMTTKSSKLAPIAEQEACEFEQHSSASSSSAIEHQRIDSAQMSHEKGMPRMVRLRRKRREDPFGTLIQSTKKMRLNEPGKEQALAGDGLAMAKNLVPSQSGQNVSEMDGVLFAEDEEDELLFYYGGQEEGDESGADGYDDSDSNDEDYYKNDYPDEENGKFISFADGVGPNEYENDSTSGDDNFDHYGDEKTKYRNYSYEKEDDEEQFSYGKMISAKKEEDSGDNSD